MRRRDILHLRSQNRVYGNTEATEDILGITTTHKLRTRLWTADVERLETAIGGFKTKRGVTDDCQVALFEIDRDDYLHVNVTHHYVTRTAPGWAGPADLPGGFVFNRRFGNIRPRQIIRHIRDMVFATRP